MHQAADTQDDCLSIQDPGGAGGGWTEQPGRQGGGQLPSRAAGRPGGGEGSRQARGWGGQQAGQGQLW